MIKYLYVKALRRNQLSNVKGETLQSEHRKQAYCKIRLENSINPNMECI